MKIRIIANPVSGGGQGKVQAEAIAGLLQARSAEVDLVLTLQAGDGRKAAGAGDVDCIVSVGGDGTANEIVNGMPENGPALAILPTGTANVVARELGIPREPELLANWIMDGSRRRMDVGTCGDRRFLLGAGAGLDAAIAHRVAQVRGRKSSLSKWVGPTILTALKYAAPPIRVTVDGELVSVDAEYAVVGNCQFSAGIFRATPLAKIDDGLLDVCLIHGLNAFKLANLALEVRNPSFITRPDIVYRQGKEIVLEPAGDEAAPLQIDGDPAGNIPATFGILPGALEVVAPQPV